MLRPQIPLNGGALNNSFRFTSKLLSKPLLRGQKTGNLFNGIRYPAFFLFGVNFQCHFRRRMTHQRLRCLDVYARRDHHCTTAVRFFRFFDPPPSIFSVPAL